MDWQVLKSAEDDSVNFVLPMAEGYVEARYVRRYVDNFIVYLSSHTGCKHACRMCHLTSTKQTYFEPVDLSLYLRQAAQVMTHYDNVIDKQSEARLVKFAWMARGEVLSNPYFVKNSHIITYLLSAMALDRQLKYKFNVSTILPKDFNGTLLSNFKGVPLDFYYSIYSMDKKFRKRWLPNAMPPDNALEMLAEWQKSEDREVVLHWPFIADQNDSEADVHAICDAVEKVGLNVRVNTVRYNPPNKRSAESPQDIVNRNLNIIQQRLSTKSKVIQKIGFDVHASCGMFVS